MVIVKPAGTGKPDARHFREAGALAAEHFLHVACSVRLACSEKINVFHRSPRIAVRLMQIFPNYSVLDLTINSDIVVDPTSPAFSLN